MFDGGGLYLEVAPAGGKWWRLKYRFDGKEKRLSLGTYPDISIKEARKRREDARTLIAQGEDPSAQRKAVRQARKLAAVNTVEALSRAWLEHRADAWAERTRTVILASLEKRRVPGDRQHADC